MLEVIRLSVIILKLIFSQKCCKTYTNNIFFRRCVKIFHKKNSKERKLKSHSFCKNSANESCGEGVELAAAWWASLLELGNLCWKTEDPDICPLDL